MRFKAAVIGCGRMGGITSDRTRAALPEAWLPLSHAEALHSLPETDLVAVSDLHHQTAAKVASAFGDCKSYADHNQMLADTTPDIVGVATRTAPREDIILDLIRHGVPAIHAEKPLALSMRSTSKILSACRNSGTYLSIGTVRRYMPVYQEYRKLIAKGIIGEIQQVIVSHGHDLLFWGHPHSFDLIDLTLNANDAKLETVQALSSDTCTPFFSDMELDCDPPIDGCMLRYNNGTSAIITRASGHTLAAIGTDGILSVCNDGEYISLQSRRADGYLEFPRRIDVADKTSGTVNAFKALISSLNNEISLLQSLDSIFAVQSALTAASWSCAHGGTCISPSEVPDDFHTTGKFNGNYP